MAHFLTKTEIHDFRLRQQRAGVIVRASRKDKTLTIREGRDSIVVLDSGAAMSWLPEDYRVLDPEGGSIRAIGRFAVTLETFDPYHVVTDIF